MKKNGRMRIDIMNRNAIISLAMLYALWQTNRQDLLDLIRPFVLYAVGNTTKVGAEIDILSICKYMEEEFGYRSIQIAVINRILARESSSKTTNAQRIIEKKNKRYVLVRSLSEKNEKFYANRLVCKEHSDAVTSSLTDFLNECRACKRVDYAQEEVERFLLSFFERQGGSIVLSVDDLRQMKAESNEMDYFIARFILKQYERKSLLFDYLVELVKGYFITTALYLQAENPNVTTSSFKDVMFFLDTPLLLAFLGYKTDEENSSVQKMVESLKKNGAKLACFTYNIDEVNSILEAYKQSLVSKTKRPSNYTLEYFDTHGHSYTMVEYCQKNFGGQLAEAGIESGSPSDYLDKFQASGGCAGLLDDERLRDIILSLKPSYNRSTLKDDLTAINTVSRIRKGRKYDYIERCKAVFVTHNPILVAAAREYIQEASYDFGFPIAITSDDLCVMAWLKDFEKSNTLPQMRLLENVLAAITPSRELMDAYFDLLEHLERQGKIKDDEAALMRVDMFAKRELMVLTCGEPSNLNGSVIEEICHRVHDQWVADARNDAKKQHKAEMKAQKEKAKNRACQQAEAEVELEFAAKEKSGVRGIKIACTVIAVAFILASYWSFAVNSENVISWAKYICFFLAVISTIQGAMPFFAKDNFLISHYKRWLQRKKLRELDARKERYLSLLDE